MEDLLKKSNKKQKDELIDFMISISKGWVMKPYRLFLNKEIENAFLHKLGLNSTHDIKSQIIGKGIAYTAGEEYYVTSKNPALQKFLDEKEKEIRDLINSTESMKKILKDDEFSLFFKQGRQSYVNFARKLERNRKLKMKNMSKIQRYNFELRSYFKIIAPHLAKILQYYNIKESVLFKTKKEIEIFLEDMPSTNTFFRLILARDEESPERKVPANDLIDIGHLSGAVPYCDIVVMEKMFASLCRKSRLDKKYGCVVCNSLKDLNNIL